MKGTKLFWILVSTLTIALVATLYFVFWKPGQLAESAAKVVQKQTSDESTGFFGKSSGPKERERLSKSVWNDERLLQAMQNRPAAKQEEIRARADELLNMFRNFQDEEFLSRIQQLIAENPDVIEYKALLADYYLDKVDLAHAEEVLEAMKALAPESDFVLRMLGGVQYEQGKLDEAEGNLNDALKVNPGAEDALYGKTAIGDAKGSLKDTFEDIKQRAEQNPQNANLRRIYSEVLESEWRFAESEAINRELLRDHPEDPKVLKRVADSAFRRQDVDEALRHYEKAYELNPQDAEVRQRLIGLWLRSGQKDRALALAKEVYERNPDDPHAALQYNALSGRGIPFPEPSIEADQ